MGSETEKFVLKIRASAAGHLMSGGNGITDKQLAQLNEYQARKDGQGKPLTAKMEDDLKELIAKRDAQPELGQTAKSYIEKLWLKIKYGYDEPVVTDELLKGDSCEQEGMDLVSVLYTGEFREKNEQMFWDDFFTGTPDTLLKFEPDVVEDTKSVWTVKTFFDKVGLEPIYEAQGQVYMHLTGRRKFRVNYCLMNTPIELVEREQRRFLWKYGGNEFDKRYIMAAEKIAKNHNVDHIPLHERVKTFEFDYDPAFIAELQEKVKLARVYFDSLKLNRK